MSIATATRSKKGAGDEWLTPLDFWKETRAVFFGRGDVFDPCPSAFRRLPGTIRFRQKDGLKADWSGKQIFVNPPFSNIEPWIKKANERMSRQATVLMLLPVRADQPWWHRYGITGRIFFIRGRVNYERPKNKKQKNSGASFASCLVLFDGARGVEAWWPYCHQDRKARRK